VRANDTQRVKCKCFKKDTIFMWSLNGKRDIRPVPYRSYHWRSLRITVRRKPCQCLVHSKGLPDVAQEQFPGGVSLIGLGEAPQLEKARSWVRPGAAPRVGLTPGYSVCPGFGWSNYVYYYWLRPGNPNF
jgi:hypothetical protein